MRFRDPDIDVATSIASNDEARVEVSEFKGEAHAVVIRLDVGQRSGPSVQCLPRSHAWFPCKVAASVRGPDWRYDVRPIEPKPGFSGQSVTIPQSPELRRRRWPAWPSAPDLKRLHRAR